VLRIEVNGRPASVDDLSHPTLVNFGHLTSMQVRDGGVRGLDLHMERLASANRSLFGADLDPRVVREYIRHALADVRDASVRVSVYWPSDSALVVVAVRPPVEPSPDPRSLLSVPYQRPVAGIKHVGSFAQIHYGRLAQRQGYDDALLTGPDGLVSEGSLSNIAFFDGSAVVWPSSPHLPGVTMRLLEPRLTVPSRHSLVRLSDVSSFGAAFLMNSQGLAAVGRIDDTVLPVDADLMTTLRDTYESVPWDPV
jgi:branched-subunit amino acid aminotransferase/4-amino-4-deoxychorismate lyase